MRTSVESARRDWAEGHRRFEAQARDPRAQEDLLAQLEIVMDELRRRIGQTFTLAELADAYTGAERWARAAVSERAATAGWVRTVALVEDAAFHLYARGAVDYEP